MRQKQSNLLPNKKLKDFYQKYNEENEVSVFTMAENMAHLQETDLYQSPVKYTDKVFEAHPIYKKVLAEKLKREEEEAATMQKSNDMVKTMQEFNAKPIIDENTKQLKTLQFQLGMLVSGGVQHTLITRFNGSTFTHLDIVEGTFQLFKIETRKILSPMKLFIIYKTKGDGNTTLDERSKSARRAGS